MKMTVSSRSFGAVAPYVVSAALLFPPVAATSQASDTSVTEACVYVDVSQQLGSATSSDIFTYTWNFNSPGVIPNSFLQRAEMQEDIAYEPFTASEGWREIRVSTGPFVVERDVPQAAFFDEYDISAIELYDQQ